MPKSFLPHFSAVLVAHLLLIFGGMHMFHSHISQGIKVSRASTFKVRVGPPTQVLTSRKPVPASPKQLTQTPVATPEPQNQVSALPSLSETARADLRSLYHAELRAEIEKNKFYPVMSQRLGQTGLVVVAFTLLEDGHIIDVRIDTPSRFERLNASALEAVKKADHFRPIPKELGETKLEIKIPIKFSTL